MSTPVNAKQLIALDKSCCKISCVSHRQRAFPTTIGTTSSRAASFVLYLFRIQEDVRQILNFSTENEIFAPAIQYFDSRF